ncbi:UDP-N-acetylmuramate dehydrogenase [Leptolyngbya sp. PCC 6406]|uniref:UDP-N-acetylmuramate dehydrogenase n=1 Tax=Leptolyngbya sp. PCC 6406 TaxID=1173264 RepID=UPI0002ACE21E|nr:UDP-N-acetylmuramate dehydrogenase [Leptolyngbya sp. PCC 6406]
MVLSIDTPTPVVISLDCPIQPQVSLARYTSYRVGGRAEWFTQPRQVDQMADCLAWATSEALPITLLGAGSNLLISDRGLLGLVICSRHLRQVTFETGLGRLTAASGEPLPNLAWKAARRGWRGLEWAVGIPGTVGGAVFMNAGAHGACTADSLVTIEGLTLGGKPVQWAAADLNFSYRTSYLQNSPHLITQATFQLEPGHDPAAVMADTQAALCQRRTTQPYHLPSCGSVFRNPIPHTAGWLIEQSGLKGYQIGQAQVSTLHANFIVNCGGAKAMDVLRLIHHVQDKVSDHWDFCLHPEVRMLGEFAPC